MIIEFIGLPGSGKTYLTKILCEDNEFVTPNNPKITYIYRLNALLNVFRSKVLFYYFIKIIFSFKNINIKLKRFKNLIYLKNYKTTPNKVTVYDQHLIQNLISFQKVLDEKIKTKWLKRFLGLFDFPKELVIIYNDVYLEKVLSRFKSRKMSNYHNSTLLDELTDEQLVIDMNQLIYFTEHTIGCLKELNIKVLLSNSDSINDFKLMKSKIVEVIGSKSRIG